MRTSEAIRFIRPAVEPDPGTLWADLGAGRGTFTEALAELLGPDARVLAVDTDPKAVRALSRLADEDAADRARIVAVEADLRRLDDVAELQGVELDGALLANVLHFFSDPAGPLADVAKRLGPGGRLVVIEYEGRSASPWVPHPLPFERLRSVAERAGLGEPRRVGTRDSAYRGAMYCAVAERPAWARPTPP